MRYKLSYLTPKEKQYIANDILSVNEFYKRERRNAMKLEQIDYHLSTEVFDAIKRIKRCV